MVVDFSWIFIDFHWFSSISSWDPCLLIHFQLRSLPRHSFPAGIPASPFISSWDPCLPIHFQLRSLPPHSFPPEIPASPFISSRDLCLPIHFQLGSQLPHSFPAGMSKKGPFCNLNRYKQCTIQEFIRFARLCPTNRRKWKCAGTYLSRAWHQDDVSMLTANSLKLLLLLL